MRNQPEKRLQQDCYKWFFNNYPELRGTMWHVQNEGKRTDYERSIIKSIGIVSGVSDLSWVYNSKYYAIEFKTDTGDQEPEQKEWERVITQQGGIYVLIRSLEEFQGFVWGVVDKK